MNKCSVCGKDRSTHQFGTQEQRDRAARLVDEYASEVETAGYRFSSEKKIGAEALWLASEGHGGSAVTGPFMGTDTMSIRMTARALRTGVGFAYSPAELAQFRTGQPITFDASWTG